MEATLKIRDQWRAGGAPVARQRKSISYAIAAKHTFLIAVDDGEQMRSCDGCGFVDLSEALAIDREQRSADLRREAKL